MQKFAAFCLTMTVVAELLVSASVARAQGNFSVLHSFTGAPTDGAEPMSPLIQGQDGMLYGTTYAGGSANLGTVFKVAPDGSCFALLHTFTGAPTDGKAPIGGLVQGPDGTLYGTTIQGGTGDVGTVYQMAPEGNGFTLLHSFTNLPFGGGPFGGLIQGPDGTLYGTTSASDAHNGGTVFSR